MSIQNNGNDNKEVIYNRNSYKHSVHIEHSFVEKQYVGVAY